MTLLNDPTLQAHFDEFGYVKLPVILGQEIVAQVQEEFRRLNFHDVFNQGYNVGANSDSRDVRKQEQEFLNTLVFPRLAPHLVDRLPYTATYMIKEPKGSIVWAHQDWTYCDETLFDSVMCWIPFQDVDSTNGAMGFIKGSHKYFDYPRGFPVPIVETPVVQHRLRLIPYIQTLDMKAGEGVIFSNKTVHASMPNYSGTARGAVSMSVRPKGQPLWTYFIKPNGRTDTLLKYESQPDFFVTYNNPTLTSLYKQGQTPEGCTLLEEVPYDLPRVEWAEMEALLASTGNVRDPWKVTKTEEFYKVRLYV